MEPEQVPKKKSRFKIEVLEERLAPAHLNPGVGTVRVPVEGTPGQQGIETAVAATDNHHKPIMISYKK